MLLATFTNTSPGCRNNTAQGLYEEVRGFYVLRYWRIAFDNELAHEGRTVGDWHRIHGNQKKAIGALKLVIDKETLITWHEQGSIRTMTSLGVAKMAHPLTADLPNI